jgi:hypothetical protein
VARRRTTFAVIGFLLVLVGGLVCLLAVVGLIQVARNRGYLTSIGWISLLAGPAMVVAGVVILVRLHRRWGLPESYGSGTVVYAWSRRSLIGWNLLAAAAALFFLFFGLGSLVDGLQHLVGGHGFTGHGGGLWAAFVGVVWFTLGLGAVSMWVVTVRRLDHQDPLLVVDDGGIECAQGRFSWRDIDRILQVTEVTGSGDGKTVHRRLAFVLRDGTTRRPVERPYDDEEAVAVSPFGFVLGITNCTKEANAALAAYGHAPVKGELSELVPAALPVGEHHVPLTPPVVYPVRTQTPSEPSEWQAAPAAGREKPLVRVRRALLIIVGAAMVLVGVITIIGIVHDMATHKNKSGVGASVGALVIGVSLVVGGGAIMRHQLRRRRRSTEGTSSADWLPGQDGNLL